MQKVDLIQKRYTIFYLGLLVVLGLAIRFYYFPFDIPIANDGFFSFVYASKTIFEQGLPIGYEITNSGWSNFLSMIFFFFEAEPAPEATAACC